MMTDDEMRVAIAEKCGWTAIENSGGAGGWIAKMPDGHTLWDNCLGATRLDAIEANCPDYLEDLNACHEMEKVLTLRESRHYKATLGRIGLIFNATARQRCETFARVCWPERWAK